MSAIDLILLGSLYQGKKSAYDLQKQVEARNLSRWVKIGSYTVYKKVVQYEKKGYVSSEKWQYARKNNIFINRIWERTFQGTYVRVFISRNQGVFRF